MEIKYKFVNGEETSISVYGEFEKIILELARGKELDVLYEKVFEEKF
ncbi:MAG: hypothetical protein ACI4PR_01720 [Acutalibacteraceae bacterium]